MSTFESLQEQIHPTTSQTTQVNQKLFKGFEAQVQAHQEEKLRIDSISNLITVLKQKQSSQAELTQTISEKKSDSSSQSSSKSLSQKQSEGKSQFRESESKHSVEVSFSESFQEKINVGSNPKPKSKFVKLHSNFATQEPHIITSSYKSFCSPSKGSLNMNSKNNQASNFLTPGNNLPSSKKQVTSAGNLVQHSENQPPTGSKTNRSAFGNKSTSSQVAKQATFAALPSKTLQQQQNSNGISLYQEVVAKNFEVIDNLLRKLNKIYSNQEEYENSLIEISEKLHKIEADNENIHHEFRTSHFMIDKKLNSITNEYSNMLHDMNLLKKMFKENGGRGSFFVGLRGNADDDSQSNMNGKRISNQRRNSKRCSGSRSSQRNSNRSVERKQSLCSSPRSSQRNSTRNSKNMNQRVSNWANLKGVDEQNLGKMLLQQINESGGWQRSQFDVSYDNVNSRKFHQGSSQGSQQEIEYDQRKNRNRNNSGVSKKSKNGQRISIDNFGREDIDVIKSYISSEVIKMSSNSQINKYTLLGIQSTINKKFENFESKIDEKFFKFQRDIIEERIQRQMRKSIVDQLQQKTTKMIQKDISALKEQTIDRINTLQKEFNMQMQKKCDKQQVRQDLKQILESMNRKVNILMDECYQKFAQRNQSKRAILFLDKKINKFIENARNLKTLEVPPETIDNTKCLSCSKNVPVPSGHHYTQSQPMLTQINCIPPQEKDTTSYENEYLETPRKNELLNHTQKRKVKFTDISNLNYASVSQIFDKNYQPLAQSTNDHSRLVASPEKPMAQTAISSKQMFAKKLKNSRTADSAHFGSINSHLKTKIWLASNENRPTTSINASFHEVKNWKSKAVSILKKEGADWRSKSHYKKAA